MRTICCFIVLLGTIQLPTPAWAPPKAQVTCSLLAPDRKVIPVYYRGDRWHTDIRLPAIVVSNESPSAVTLQQIDVIGRFEDREYVRNSLFETELGPMVTESNHLLNRLTGDPGNPWRSYNLKKMYGNVVPPEQPFAESLRLDRGASTCLDLGKLTHLQFEGPVRIDEVVLRLTLNLDGEASTLDYLVTLTPYECKGDYIFPLRGSVTIGAMPLNEVLGHRDLPSSEFAFDVIDCRHLEGGTLASSSPPRSTRARDYFAFGREVLAVADGKVVALGNDWPDAWAENPLEFTDERIKEQTIELIDRGVDFQNAYLGNYVIIDHLNGEYSAYVHLSENSVPVRVGDAVKQGQVIGRLGNTGNSDEPHLHFQLMDSPDYPSANGLPVRFRNLPLPRVPSSDLEESNTLIYSDYLFATVE